MKASFIVRFHSRRLDNLNQLLRFLEKWHRPIISESQLVLVCQDACERVPNAFERYDHFNLELDCMMQSRITNFGVEKSLADKLVMLDGDRVATEGFYQKTLGQVEPGVQITCQTIHNLDRPTEDWEIEQGKYDYFVDKRTPDKIVGRRCVWSGNVTFMKSDFYKAGRMDESYVGYGFEDNDMTRTMEAAGVRSVYMPDDIEIHLWHERKTYGSDNKNNFINNGLHFCKKWNEPLPQFLREDIANHRKAWL